MRENESPPIQIKADRNGFTLVPDPGASFESVVEYVEKRLSESREFFQGSQMVLDLRGKVLRTDEVLRLRNLLVDKGKMKLVEVKLGDDVSFILEGMVTRPALPPRANASSDRVAMPVIVRSTCRSGARIVSPFDCVVLGDVNPGAEVIAAGDVIVFGNLRGVAHAGAGGDRSARIWALSIEPNQLRIADLVAVPPRGGKPTPKRYEIAEVQNDLIQVITL